MTAENSPGANLAKLAYEKANAILSLYGIPTGGNITRFPPMPVANAWNMPDLSKVRTFTVERSIFLEQDTKIEVALYGDRSPSGAFTNIMLEAGYRVDALLSPIPPILETPTTDQDEDDEPWERPYGGPCDIKFLRIAPDDLSLEGFEYIGRGMFRHDRFGSLELEQRRRVIFVLDRLGLTAGMTEIITPSPN